MQDDLDTFMSQRGRLLTPPDPMVWPDGSTRVGTALHRLEAVFRSSPDPTKPNFKLFLESAPLAGDLSDCLAVCDQEDPAVAKLAAEVNAAIDAAGRPGIAFPIRQGDLVDLIRKTRQQAARAGAAA